MIKVLFEQEKFAKVGFSHRSAVCYNSLLPWPHFDYVILSWLLDLEMGSRWTVSFHVLNLSYPNYIMFVTYLMKCLSSIFVNSACGNRKILDA